MGKPSLKFFIVFNLVMNIPLATAMSIGGMIFSGNAANLATPALPINILLGFILAYRKCDIPNSTYCNEVPRIV